MGILDKLKGAFQPKPRVPDTRPTVAWYVAQATSNPERWDFVLGPQGTVLTDMTSRYTGAEAAPQLPWFAQAEILAIMTALKKTQDDWFDWRIKEAAGNAAAIASYERAREVNTHMYREWIAALDSIPV